MRFAPLPEEVRARSAPLRRARGRAAGRRPLERARRGQRRGDASRASRRVPLGARGDAASATRSATAGRACTRRGRSAYRAQARRDARPAMGVTVQQMVDAEVSGVLFTCNPVSGDPSMVAVNASWGLGLAVVGGETTPGRLPRQQGHGRGRAPGDRLEGRSSTCPTRRAGTVRIEVRPTAATRPASTRSGSRRSSTSASASSGTSARTRTSSGRSSADRRCLPLAARRGP